MLLSLLKYYINIHNTFLTDVDNDGNGLKGYVENLACQCQGNLLYLQIHCEAQVAEICLPARRGQ